MNKTSVSIIALLVIILVGGGIYWYTTTQPASPASEAVESQTETVTDSQTSSLSITDSETADTAETSEASLTITEPEATDLSAPPKQESVQSAVDLIFKDTESALKIAVQEKPTGFERAKIVNQDIEVGPDGVSATAYVLAEPNWDTGNMSDIQTFYIEKVGPSPCWTDPDNCDEPTITNWYGPFESQLKMDLQ